LPEQSAPDTRFYEVFGLGIEADRPIAGLVEAAALDRIDVRIRSNTGPPGAFSADGMDAPFYRSPFRDAAGQSILSAWTVADGAYVRLAMSDGTEFFIDRKGTQIWIAAVGTNASIVSEYLLGPVAGIVLRRRGVVCLHASAVRIGGNAVAFAGQQGAGKSTIAAAFAMRGHELITDDLAPLVDDGGMLSVQPGAPYLRIRHGMVDSMADDLRTRGDVMPTVDGLYVDFVPDRRRTAALPSPGPLAAVYCLDWSDRRRAGPSRIEPMTGTSAVIGLAADTWAARLQDAAERADEVEVLTRLVNHVPVRRIAQVPAGHLDDLVDRIVAEIAKTASKAGTANLASFRENAALEDV